MQFTRPVTHQQHRIRSHATNTDCFAIFNLLTSNALLEQVDSLSPEHRERLLTPTNTLSMFICQALNADRSCQYIVNQTAMTRAFAGLTPGSTATGAYCKARQRLPLSMVRSLTRYISEHVEQQSPEQWRWNGHRVRIVDGTTVTTMPDTAENQVSFPQQGSQKPGWGFPICRIVGVTDLYSGLLADAAIGRFNGKGANEQALLRELSPNFIPGDIIMGDAFFPTWFFMADMQAAGVELVMEQMGARQRVTDFNAGTKLGKNDHTIERVKPKIKPAWMTRKDYESYPESITVRELAVNHKILVTTLVSAKQYSKKALGELYRQRWNIELDIRCIKDTMGMNVLSCKTPEMAIKEIWVYLLAYNLIRLIMAQSSKLHDLLPRQISFKHGLQMWLSWLGQPSAHTDETLWILFELIAQQQVGNRPGRVEPRAVKRRPKAYPLLMQPRRMAREEITKFGHPKKLK